MGYLEEMVYVADPVELAYIDEGAESLFGVCEEGGRVGCVGDQTAVGSLVTVTADKSQDLLACIFQGRRSKRSPAGSVTLALTISSGSRRGTDSRKRVTRRMSRYSPDRSPKRLVKRTWREMW